ncbi:Transcription elongation factor 1-like protein [Elsinoe fawcettii]|nr:Transcription elongation factor 1-like protein [Elsinoe fawcettii]
MGKRKSAAKPEGKKKREGLASTFQCLFCNHENSVTVKLDKKTSTGELTCKVCGQSYQTGINYLSAPIDVYSDWIDACDAVAKEAASGTSRPAPARQGPAQAQRAAPGEKRTAEDDGFIEDDEGDVEAEYADE